MKKYMDIERLKPKHLDGFDKGDLIYIQEKIDGANFSIKYDEETDSIKAFSRQRELDFKETLRGAWTFAQSLDKELLKAVLGCSLILFGEWLVKHSVPYPDDKYHKAYFYDVYDSVNEVYLSQDKTIAIVEKLGLLGVPTFYIGEFQSWEHINSLLGLTQMGGEYGEGIVIKNMTKLNNPNNRLPFYVKSVCEQFCETKAHHIKVVDIDAMNEREQLKDLASTIVTIARVNKIINKFVDEGLIEYDWDEKSMSVIAKNLGRRVYEDCIKEEKDTVDKIGSQFGKFSSAIAMNYVRDILKER